MTKKAAKAARSPVKLSNIVPVAVARYLGSTHEALGDVISRLAPFLRLYATYTAGFEDAITTLTDCTKRDRKFDTVVREFEHSSISTGMGLSSYMLEPVQRIPRYRLLLLDYLKYLPPNSPDRPKTESALNIISEAADRSNDRIKELEIANTVLAIQRNLVDYEGTLLAPSRWFIKKGTLLKSSRKTLVPRFFILFSDILLHTYPPEKDIYRFRNEMPIFGMKVEDPKASLTPFSFNIYSTTRSLILVANSEEEKQSWISALQNAIDDDFRKRSSLKRDALLQIHKANSLFGTKAPIMVPDKSVTMCQTCCAEFTMIFRRHHCRACGKVVCGNCSQQKAYLPYIKRVERVCDPCYFESKNPDKLSGDETVDSPPVQSPGYTRKQASTTSTGSGVLNLKAYEEDAVIAGYVMCQDGRKWTKMWYQIKKDYVLYKFKAHEDIKAITSMPLPGYTVKSDTESLTITLGHHSGKKNYCETFKVDDEAALDNWLECLQKVVNMEFDSVPSRQQKPLSPLARDSREFSESVERPASQLSQRSVGGDGSFNNSFSSSGSRPSSLVKDVSPAPSN